MKKDALWTEKHSSGDVGFPISKHTPVFDLEVVRRVFERNGYAVDLEPLNDKQMLLSIGLNE